MKYSSKWKVFVKCNEMKSFKNDCFLYYKKVRVVLCICYLYFIAKIGNIVV